MFDRFHLAEAVDRLYPFQLSGGMARRVLVSTAVLSGASLILADEPTPGMDLEMALEALQCFRELADEGRTVVLITHDIDLAFQVADRGGGILWAVEPPWRFLRAGGATPPIPRRWNALQNSFQPVPGSAPMPKASKGCLYAPDALADGGMRCEIPMGELRGRMVRCIHAT